MARRRIKVRRRRPRGHGDVVEAVHQLPRPEACRAWRVAHGLTQGALAVLIGMSPRTVSRFESGAVTSDEAWRGYWERCLCAMIGAPAPWSLDMTFEPEPGLVVTVRRPVPSPRS